MSIKLLISFGELGYGFARKVSKIEVPASWTNSRPIADIIMLVCEDYNKTKAGGSAIAADSTSHAVLDANEVYLASSDGSRIDPTELCSRLSTGDYFIKMEKERQTVDRFVSTASQSWISQLNMDPHSEVQYPNRRSRQVFSGHYVPVEPEELPDPVLVAYSPSVMKMVGLDSDFAESDAFLRFFSGRMSAMSSSSGRGFRSWATPYALSIDGNEYYNNCPFQTGNGYGDGRAISIAEVVVPESDQQSSQDSRWELQMKGAGRTPFCRGGDGRSVLRSSVREFLGSEAMHHLGVSTTRAISLITSQSAQVARAWFSPSRLPLTLNDPRIASYPVEVRRQIVREVNGEPNIMVHEQLAISTRVAPSFMRVGHIELFARRYRASLTKGDEEEKQLRRSEFRLIVEHMLFREFGGPEPLPTDMPDREDFQPQVLSALRESSRRVAQLTADWMRVGYCQGNFNSDNCLVAGRTMDYGPFGFVERYEKTWNMWSGGGEKYSFRHQHSAGERNFYSLATAVSELLDDAGKNEVVEDIIPAHRRLADEAVNDTFRRKMGITTWCTSVEVLFNKIDSLLEETEADYTMFWRQLAILPAEFLPHEKMYSTMSEWSDSIAQKEKLMEPFTHVFYKSLSADEQRRWTTLLVEWLFLLQLELSADRTGASISTTMRQVNPKYVPREWMLVDAYSSAALGNYEPVRKLQLLFETPYDEHEDVASEFYQRMPDEYLDRGGVSVMT